MKGVVEWKQAMWGEDPAAQDEEKIHEQVKTEGDKDERAGYPQHELLSQ